MSLTDEQLEDLVVAALSVNSWSIEQTWRVLPGLREHALTNASSVVQMPNDEIIKALEAAGYKRGRINWIVGPRLHSLMEAVASGGLDGLPALVQYRDQTGAESLLRQVPGVGPKIADTAWRLLTSEKAPWAP